MPMRGIRKAALLLMSLDRRTAAELLKSAEPETVKEIAAEVAYLRANGQGQGADPGLMAEFCEMLDGGGGGDDFVSDLLKGAMGTDAAQRMLGQV